MRKFLNKPWFVAVLVLGAAVLVGQSFLERGQNRFAAAPSAEAETIAAEEHADEPAETVRLPVREALAALIIPANLPDPFARRRAAASDAEPEQPVDPDIVDTVRLSATWRQGEVALALLNDRICRAGDVIGRVKIESVSIDGVWLRHWKGRDFVAVGRDFTLVTPARQAAAATFALHEG